MTITEFRMQLVFQEGFKQGFEQGFKRGIEQSLERNVIIIFDKGYSAESIADLLSKPLAKVQQIIARYQASKKD
jgi:flagellar biosynthesis/type III secretory pathway protein FliH